MSRRRERKARKQYGSESAVTERFTRAMLGPTPEEQRIIDAVREFNAGITTASITLQTAIEQTTVSIDDLHLATRKAKESLCRTRE
jgi:hypothetical protein